MGSCSKDSCCSRTRVEPFNPAGQFCGQGLKPCGSFDFANENTGLFGCWASEQLQASGTEVDYFSQAKSRAVLDPLYNEPISRAWDGPYRLKCLVEQPQQNFEVREEGSRIVWDGVLWLPRVAVESSAMADIPKEGDVCKFWNNLFFDALYSVDPTGGSPAPPNAGYYFDVISVNEEGHPFDSAAFTMFKCLLKRRTEFTPERRLANQT